MTEAKMPVSQRRLREDAEVGLLEVTCPLCDGKGKLSRTYLYDQLGVRDMAKLATHTAKEAVTELTNTLWTQYKDNLDKQVKAEVEVLSRDIDELKSERGELEARNKALTESIAAKEAAARDAQRNEDGEALLKEKEKLQGAIAELQGQVAEAKAEYEALRKQQQLEVKGAEAKIKEEANGAAQELQERINRMNESLLEERVAKAALQTQLERLQNEVSQKVLEARQEALKDKEADLEQKDSEVDAVKEELAELKAALKLVPAKEQLARTAAIQEQEGKLRKVELDRDILQRERDQLQEQLTEAKRKLEQTKGKVEERTFEEMVAEVRGYWIEDWRSKKESGDYHVGLYDKDGEKLLPSKVVVDNKDVGRLTDKEVDKLVRDALKQNVALAAMVVSDEAALRPKDKDARFELVGGVTLLRTTRDWFLRDLDLLKPLMRRQAEEGPDFMTRNVAVAAEVRSHMKAIDKMERFMRLARENAEKAEKALKEYRSTIDDICRNAGHHKAINAGGDE